jgi:hypothetical protein
MNIAVKTPQQVQAWRITFSLQQRFSQPPLIHEPRSVWVKAYEQDLKAALFDDTPGDKATGLTVVFVPSGAATPRSLQKQIETWMESRQGEYGGPVEVHTTSGRFLWRRGRALCFGLPNVLEEALVGLIRFSFCEVELERLETQVQECWPLFETDIGLMQRMTSRALKHQTHIERMTRVATELRARYLRLLAALEAPKSALPGHV